MNNRIRKDFRTTLCRHQPASFFFPLVDEVLLLSLLLSFWVLVLLPLCCATSSSPYLYVPRHSVEEEAPHFRAGQRQRRWTDEP
jgi:hypothetical protein